MQMECLEKLDRDIVLAINGMHQLWLDEIMWLASDRLIFIPLYVILLYGIWRKTNALFACKFLIVALLTIFVVDQLSVYAFKEVFQRYRPSHHEELSQQLHFYQTSDGEEYLGGKYGFVSSHAANMLALLTLTIPVFRDSQRWINGLLMGIVLIVLFSRIYLGVHYLSDIVVGGLLGYIVAFLTNKYILQKWANI
ncbi:MAG: hypothetical protein RL037_595 [Bacteroidota bacterium]